jgi:hypothetical protein
MRAEPSIAQLPIGRLQNQRFGADPRYTADQPLLTLLRSARPTNSLQASPVG